jgi:methionyl-tRNA formyltransferase
VINAVYMATPEIAVNCLQKLLNFNDLNIQAVVTQPDRPCGRGKKLTAPPVKDFALAHNIEVLQTESLKNDEALKSKLRELNPDFFITFAFGQLLTEEILAIPKIATINLHASLLPEYRGANPIQRAIYDGKEETGITTMLTVLALDAGDICIQEKIKITPDMTDKELMEIISDKAPFIMYPTIKQLYNKMLTPKKQDESLVTIAKKFKKEDALLDWNRSAQELHNHVRSMTTWPCACSSIDGKNIKILKTTVLENESVNDNPGEIVKISKDGIAVAAKKGILLITELKPEGKPKMDAYAWTNGVQLKIGGMFK